MIQPIDQSSFEFPNILNFANHIGLIAALRITHKDIKSADFCMAALQTARKPKHK
jgi:hypothetical protein